MYSSAYVAASLTMWPASSIHTLLQHPGGGAAGVPVFPSHPTLVSTVAWQQGTGDTGQDGGEGEREMEGRYGRIWRGNKRGRCLGDGWGGKGGLGEMESGDTQERE